MEAGADQWPESFPLGTSSSLSAAPMVTRLRITTSLTKGFWARHGPHMCPFTHCGRDWTPLQSRTPGLGEVWQPQPALPAEKGTPGMKPVPPPPSSYCVHWTQGGPRPRAESPKVAQ